MNNITDFLATWDDQYQTQILKIPLFQERSSLNLYQQKKFAAVFYHLRGHFYRFLWYLAGRAPDNRYKKIVLANISEEFGGQLDSHEELYWEFCKALNVNISEEILNPKFNLKFTELFNQTHLEFILKENWPAAWAAFAAYERLDNIDYANLKNLALKFDLPAKALKFFEVHTKVTHFEKTEPLLSNLYLENFDEVKKGFEFISKHQIQMWKNLSESVLS
ncbi:MAG: iron-containing redox enzyme family protein [bacterium]